MNRSVFEYFRRPDCNCCAPSECYSWTDCGFTWTRNKIKKFIIDADLKKSDLNSSDVLLAVMTFISLFIASFLEAVSRILAASCPYRGDHHPVNIWLVYSWTLVMTLATLVVKCVELKGWNMTRKTLNIFNILGVIMGLTFVVAFDQNFCLEDEYASFHGYKKKITLVNGTHLIAGEILPNQPKADALRKTMRCVSLSYNCYIQTYTRELFVLIAAMFVSWVYCVILLLIQLKEMTNEPEYDSTDLDTESTQMSDLDKDVEKRTKIILRQKSKRVDRKATKV